MAVDVGTGEAAHSDSKTITAKEEERMECMIPVGFQREVGIGI
jgi:hypothetical protein